MGLLPDHFGIPQNLLVDPKGAWGWMRGGFDVSDPNWKQKIIQKLESVQASN